MSHIANDGIQYISTAKNWLAGNGFATDTLMYTPHFQGNLPAAQTVWPNGYPFAIALLMKLGIEIHVASFTLNHLAHAMAAIIMWLLLQKMGVGRFFATVCTFAFYCMSMPWAYVSAGMTEPVFTTLLLSALLFLPNPKHSTLPAWILCGAIIAAAIYVRFSTVFFAASTGTGIMLYLLLYERDRPAALIKPFFKLALLVSLPTLAFGHLMYRTYTLIGTFDRYSGLKDPESFVSTLKLWIVVTSEQLGFSTTDLVGGKITNSLFLLFILLVAVIVLWFLLVQRNVLRESPTDKSGVHLRVVGMVAVLHMLTMVTYLSYASMTSSPLEIISRYTYQIYPGLFAVFCFMTYTLFNRYSADGIQRSTSAYRSLKGVVATLVALYLFAQINAAMVTRTHYFTQPKSASQLMKMEVSNNTSLGDFIKACFDKNSHIKSIWSTHGQSIHLHTGIPTLSHPHIYTKNPFSAKEFSKRASDYNSGMFIFLDIPHLFDVRYDNYMSSAKDWIKNQGFTQLHLQNNRYAHNFTAEIYVLPECSI